MKYIIFSILFLIANTSMLAYDAEIDGIYYNFSGDEAEVTYKVENADNNYSGDVIIPEFVTFEGKEYRVTSIGYKAFYHCTDNISVSIPKCLKIIRFLAFVDCKGLTNISIPVGVETIEQHAFEGCANLLSVELPESLTTMGSGTFFGCKSLTSITISKGIQRIYSDTFYGCSSLSSVIIPEGVKYIDTSAFHGCTSLTSIKIPGSVEKIHERVFESCKNLKSITLSENLAHLGSDAFWGCSNLTEITCKSQNPPATLYKDQVGLDRPSGVFYGVDKQNCKLYVPKGCEEAYRAAELWKDFNIIEMGTGISEVKNERVKSEKYDDVIYDLSGRKINSQFSIFNSQFPKGLYLVNGRKVAVK